MPFPMNILYYGKNDPLPEQIPLRAGPLTMLYENGDLRYLKLGDQEIVRRLYVAIRDRNWGTILPVFTNVQMNIGADAFQISYDVTNQQGEIDFRWHGAIRGDAQGNIMFSMDGTAHSDFMRCRIGFCLLHPMEVSGAMARIEHVDGTVEENAFPIYIAPQWVINGEIKPVAPFNEMRAVTHEVEPGVWTEVRFDGEIFEMEDQRNWTDASYKTYGTPLRLPFPVAVKAGTKIQQTVTIKLKDGQSSIVNRQSSTGGADSVVFTIGDKQTKLPKIGLGVALHGQPLSQQEIERLRLLNLSHLRVDLRLAEPSYENILRRATAEAQALGVQLEAALHLSDAAADELKGLVTLLGQIKPPIATWLVFHNKEKSTSASWVKLAREALTTYEPSAKIGAGTNVYFTELNRGRPPVDALDVVAYSINPQVHAIDNASLVETLAAQAPTIHSARQFCGNLPLHVSPVTLQPRFNPNATGPTPEPGPNELPPQVDVRQMSLFGAGWTLGSIKYLAETSDVTSVTYYETTGWRGVMETATGSPVPEKFQSIPGGVFPLYHVLADVGEFASGEVVHSRSSDILRVDGLALHQGNRLCILLANMTGLSQSVSVQGLGGQATLRRLDETNAEAAMQRPEAFRAVPGASVTPQQGALAVSLKPYALVRLDMLV